MKRQRRIATIVFVVVMALVASEVALLFLAKDHHDREAAKTKGQEISVELGLISSALSTGNQSLYKESLSRYRQDIAALGQNEYVRAHRNETLVQLSEYSSMLAEDDASINTLLELRAALSALLSELQEVNNESVDALNFYRIEYALNDLRDALGQIESESFVKLREAIVKFAGELSKIADTAATCVSICPDKTFDEKLKQLDKIRSKYQKEFLELGPELTEKYNASELIKDLSDI